MDIYPSKFGPDFDFEEAFLLPRLRATSNQYFVQVEKNVRPTGCVFCKRMMEEGEFRVHPSMMNVNMCLSCAEIYFRELADDIKDWRENPERRMLLKGV